MGQVEFNNCMVWHFFKFFCRVSRVALIFPIRAPGGTHSSRALFRWLHAFSFLCSFCSSDQVCRSIRIPTTGRPTRGLYRYAPTTRNRTKNARADKKEKKYLRATTRPGVRGAARRSSRTVWLTLFTTTAKSLRAVLIFFFFFMKIFSFFSPPPPPYPISHTLRRVVPGAVLARCTAGRDGEYTEEHRRVPRQ